jgi:selenocysteine-specific elongation factor
MNVIVGTAGHIDHGKTALVKALTGVDADRLPEEKQRGITIDLGFAEMSLGNIHFGFVDVPGHERFVRNMLAGASGIDLVLLVIAADEGVMPQTREHFDICRLLDIRTGIVVLTKCDLVDAETLELARLDAAELVAGTFLEKASVLAVSAKTEEGVEQLKAELLRTATQITRSEDRYVARLPIDRSFTMKGFGAVVTGTLASGEISEGGEMMLMPNGIPVRVRGLQSHGRSVTSVLRGSRTAVNLGGIDHSNVTRGMLLTEPGALRSTQVMDCRVELLVNAPRPLRSRQRIRLHIGTAEILARVQVLDGTAVEPGSDGYVQFRLESPITAVLGEKFIIRSYSPTVTVGGGSIVDPIANKHRSATRSEAVTLLKSIHDAPPPEQVAAFVLMSGPRGATLADLQAHTGWNSAALSTAIRDCQAKNKIAHVGKHLLAPDAFQSLKHRAGGEIAAFHRKEPLARGISRESLKEKVFAHLDEEIFTAVIADLVSNGKVIAERDTLRLASHKAELSPDEKRFSDALVLQYRKAGLEVPRLADAIVGAMNGSPLPAQTTSKCVQRLIDQGELVRATDEFHFHSAAVRSLEETLKQHASATGERVIDVPAFKDIAGVSRKYAIPLLEYFDRIGVTARRGDKRVIL